MRDEIRVDFSDERVLWSIDYRTDGCYLSLQTGTKALLVKLSQEDLEELKNGLNFSVNKE